MNFSLLIYDSEALEVISFLANIVFITWGLASIFQNKKHKREFANIFSSEYKAAKELENYVRDKDVKLQVSHFAEFIKAITRNLLNRSYDEVRGQHNNFFIHWIKNRFRKPKKSNGDKQ